MELYYTGADVFEGVQTDNTLSLGGFKSQTLVPNGMIGSLFGDISLYTLNEGLRETKALILKNTVGDISNLRVWFEKTVDTIGTFYVGAVEINLTPEGVVKMEKISSTRALPFQCNFEEADGGGNEKLLLSTFQEGDYLGIWLRRDIISTNQLQDCDSIYEKFLEGRGLVTVGDLSIILEWD